MTREVSFATRILTHYRVPFHQKVRELLAERGVRYRLVHGQPSAEEAAKEDLAALPWAERIDNHALPGKRSLVWQPVASRVRTSDLVILGQESQLLANYPLQLLRNRHLKVALFGHGRNFQSRNPDGLAERWKRFWATKCDWWFAYTDETRRHVASLGFPSERITVFNNAVDTAALREAAGGLSGEDIAAAAAKLGLKGKNTAIFVGGLYPDKRLDFLVRSAERVRECIPDFELIVIGGGVELPMLRELAATRPWIFVTGPLFGSEKAALMRNARLFLMPGLVGLAVLDAFTLGLPMVTTAWPWHSPEVAYLADGENGLIVQDWQNPLAYGDAVAALMLDDARREAMAQDARRRAGEYTIEAMARRFADGVLAALDAPPR